MNFNSHAHVERDTILFITKALFHISTHTLTWSVTSDFGFPVTIKCISTHTLTWSVTLNVSYEPVSKGFQLTRSRGA